MSTWNGFGTTYRGFSYPNRDGSHHATQWAVLLFLPVIPLRRHRLTVGDSSYTQYGNGSTSVTHYAVHEETPLVGGEILRTYLTWWVIGPLIVFGPPALALVLVGDGIGFMTYFLLLASCVAWCIWVGAAIEKRNRRERALPPG
ncbi:hypothetical protein GCM10010503_39660 [Streptomyces lucensis JCM 4490]|uniref:Uncharacterized protein n=1 Tax=Streptomyces lucensis JCM 4490 TaxID=1306176 RepID=A0A918MTI3_9ACTN|nr:hypothetical protein [Streptomyces lucensis]GGW58638.1 hypothetical protein GCM10010503_39660 [Streptomyces lucensis JCM 4490]